MSLHLRQSRWASLVRIGWINATASSDAPYVKAEYMRCRGAQRCGGTMVTMKLKGRVL
jgi:hypothetical protein